MILRSGEANAEIQSAMRAGRLISDDAAQTIASWWYSPRQRALVALVTSGRVVPGLADEVRAELRGASGVDREDLTALLRWAEARVARTEC